ncbi:TRAP transporter substrate-binding protein DctP [Novosphingobium sp. PP1Y]|uniref:TRAP transporter substrate-binding protein n=1 Tax=Novosphingobium sp. PP1Y TaxID=702113 RepID=UPI00020F0446|nr:TRAP transporter substrate-binding protein DctP [Novosphingobium sp. PP1Y]CCA90974.1 TRAP-type C4-dicarboxylate transport system,periplasmic component [Novosphingobium sp. PP1Y]
MIVRSILLALTLLVAGCARPAPEGVTELSYASPYGPNHPFSKADQAWMDWVARVSKGTLRIRPNWSGSLLSSDMSMEELRHGVADIGLITPIYSRGGTHLTRIQAGFYSSAESMPSQLALFDCMLASSPQLASELHGLKVLAVQGGPSLGIVTRNRALHSLDDIKGLRIRAPTELLTVLGSLGADPVNMPMNEVYSALAKGVIDGVVAPADTFRSLHFAEVASYYSTLRIPRGAYPSRAMGEAQWNALSEQQRDILQRGVAVWQDALMQELKVAWQKGYDEAVHSGVAISGMSDADQRRFDALYLQDAERNARGLDRFGIDGLAVFRTARASIAARDQVRCSKQGE